MVELADLGDVNSDVEQYYRLSEQIPTLLAMETVLDGAGEVLFRYVLRVYIYMHIVLTGVQRWSADPNSAADRCAECQRPARDRSISRVTQQLLRAHWARSRAAAVRGSSKNMTLGGLSVRSRECVTSTVGAPNNDSATV